MKNGGFEVQPLMRLTLGLTLALLAAFWITNAALYFSRMDLSSASVVSYYNGSEAEFRPPRSAQSMLETTHMHLPMMGMVLLFLTHLLIFVPLSRPAKVGFIVAAFASALASEGAGWLVRFVGPGFAPLKVAGFVGLQASLLFLIGAIAVFLYGGRRRSERAERAASADPAGPCEADRSGDRGGAPSVARALDTP